MLPTNCSHYQQPAFTASLDAGAESGSNVVSIRAVRGGGPSALRLPLRAEALPGTGAHPSHGCLHWGMLFRHLNTIEFLA